MKIVLPIIFILNFNISLCGQYSNIKKSELKKLFQRSIEKESRKKVNTLSNPWVINNTDSLYFKADTIKLINQKNWRYDIGFCENINWNFYRKNKFCLSESQTCREPSTQKVVALDNFYQLEIKETVNSLIIQINNRKNQIEKFTVLSIFKSEDKTEITLKRIKNKASS